MSWLDEIKRGYRFRCTLKDCGSILDISGEEVTRAVIDEYDGKEIICPECEKATILEYAGFYNIDPIGLSSYSTRETYDKNGRQAVKIGNTHMSMSKYNYLETGKVENQYTPAYKAHLMKEVEKNEYLLKTETNKRRAMVNRTTAKEMDKKISKLPDGEYTVTVKKPNN